MEVLTASEWMIIIEGFLCTTIGFYLGWCQAALMRNSGKSFVISMAMGFFWSGAAWGVLEVEQHLRFNFWGRAGVSTLISIIALSILSFFTRTKTSSVREEVADNDKKDSQKAA